MKNRASTNRRPTRPVLQIDRDTLRLLTGGRLRDDGGTDHRTESCPRCADQHQAELALFPERS
jgi:hypothetical protein